MIENQPNLPLELPVFNLRSIEGGRSIVARNTQSSFAVDTSSVSTQLEGMAGYVVIAWDDEGLMASAYHCGSRNPFSPAMLPDLLRGRIAADILSGEPA